MYIVLGNLSTLMGELRKYVVSDEWQSWNGSKTQIGKEVESIILTNNFWEEAKVIVKICQPILKLLRLVDRGGGIMGLVYEMMDKMIESLQTMDIIDVGKKDAIREMCLSRWEMMHSPLHAAGFVLHPMWLGKGQESDNEVQMGWTSTYERWS